MLRFTRGLTSSRQGWRNFITLRSIVEGPREMLDPANCAQAGPGRPVQCAHFHLHKVFQSEEKRGSVPKEEKSPELTLVEDNFVVRMYKKLFSGVPKSKLKASGYILLTYCTQSTELEKFFRTFGMADTYYSWFLVTELHVWMLGCRLMREGEYGRIVRNAMVEAFWQDCDTRAKSTGDLAASVRSKQIMSMAEEFQAALFVYDEGLLGTDRELAGALWRRFFLSMVEDEGGQVPDMEKLALLVDYVRRTMSYLDSADAVTLLIKAQLQWPPLEETIRV